MRVRKLLDQKGYEVYSVSPDTSVYDALKLMAEKEIGARAAQRADLLVLKGERGPAIHSGALAIGRSASDGQAPAPFDTYTNQEAARYLAEHPFPEGNRRALDRLVTMSLARRHRWSGAGIRGGDSGANPSLRKPSPDLWKPNRSGLRVTGYSLKNTSSEGR